MGWTSEEYGRSHEGGAGAVLADGSEPGPVSVDLGSGGDVHRTSEWWAYTGAFGRPRAAAYRGRCSCGWRGPAYPVDWERLDDGGKLSDLDTSGPYGDWRDHLRAVEARTVPLPEELAELLARLDERLEAVADQAPVAALKAVAAVERMTSRISREAAWAVEEDGLSWEAVGTALGLTAEDARSRLADYLRRG
ncbi:hypothetical protein C6N75_27395 [Streptomyces solincola]|uniref:Uncharacterized protein n=1 Tax=Streptomyces solincola TaxID=2100817 RepID=A0A2S9PNW5_9ACTN|nr:MULTISPECIES: hypothetical protein [Streptomyces]PRH76106.1 hypothetical protein C6N75_27395 [Streptomyces solincola]